MGSHIIAFGAGIVVCFMVLFVIARLIDRSRNQGHRHVVRENERVAEQVTTVLRKGG